MPPNEPLRSSAETPTSACGRGGFPLSALFVFVTVFAILAAMLSPLVRHEIDGDWLVGGTVAASLIGVVAGFFAGALYSPRLIFVPLGVLSGLMLGLCVGPLVAAPVDSLAAIFVACAGGAVAIVGVAVIVRLAERRRELPPISAADSTPRPIDSGS